jgi:hypothetical protein
MKLTRAYGASPLHLLALLASFALAAYAVLRASSGPLPLRMAVWFVGAVVLHDLVLFPLYALADRTLGLVVRRRGRSEPGGGVNYVRVPALLSGLLLLMFFPLVFRKSEPSYGAASGLDQAPYLSHWLLLTALLFLGSAVVLAVRAALNRRSHA